MWKSYPYFYNAMLVNSLTGQSLFMHSHLSQGDCSRHVKIIHTESIVLDNDSNFVTKSISKLTSDLAWNSFRFFISTKGGLGKQFV